VSGLQLGGAEGWSSRARSFARLAREVARRASRRGADVRRGAAAPGCADQRSARQPWARRRADRERRLHGPDLRADRLGQRHLRRQLRHPEQPPAAGGPSLPRALRARAPGSRRSGRGGRLHGSGHRDPARRDRPLGRHAPLGHARATANPRPGRHPRRHPLRPLRRPRRGTVHDLPRAAERRGRGPRGRGRRLEPLVKCAWRSSRHAAARVETVGAAFLPWPSARGSSIGDQARLRQRCRWAALPRRVRLPGAESGPYFHGGGLSPPRIAGDAWTVAPDRTLSRIDRRTNRRVARIDLASAAELR
jgi:hypothetical protein